MKIDTEVEDAIDLILLPSLSSELDHLGLEKIEVLEYCVQIACNPKDMEAKNLNELMVFMLNIIDKRNLWIRQP